MSAKLEQLEKNVVKLTIEVDAATFEVGMQKSFKKNANQFSVQGFRKGKAPRHIVERLYGEYVLYDDAVNFVIPDAYDKAVEELNLTPVDRPEVDVEQIGNGQNLIFTATVTVKPEVVLGEYKGVKVKKAKFSVTDADVDAEVQKVAEQNSRLVSVTDRPVKEQDTAYIDFEGFVDGVAFEGGKGENYPLVIGSGSFIPGFEEQLIGAELGQDVEVKVTFPEEYHSADLQGKEAVFKCKVNEIKFKELPTVDDEFVQDISEFDTLDAYKADVKDKLEKDAKEKADRENENNVVAKVTELSEIDLPQVMVERQIDAHIRDIEQRLMYQGMPLDQYLEMIGQTRADLRAQFAENAEKQVRTQLTIEAISKAESIEATEEEVDAKIAELAESYKKTAEEMKKMLNEDDYAFLKDQIVYEKTIAFLVKNAKLTAR